MMAGKTKRWMRWGWAGGIAAVLGGCGGMMVRPPYRPADGNAVQSPYDVASPGDEIFTRQSDAFPLATVSLPNNPGEKPKVNSVLDILQPATAGTAPAIRPAPATEPVPTQIIGGPPATLPAASPGVPEAATPQIAPATGQGK